MDVLQWSPARRERVRVRARGGGAHQPNQQQHTTATIPTTNTKSQESHPKSQESQFRNPLDNKYNRAHIKYEPVRDIAALTSADPLSQAATGECVKTVNAKTNKKRTAARLNETRGCASLRPNSLWRRTAPDPESGERPLAYVKKRILKQVPVAAQH